MPTPAPIVFVLIIALLSPVRFAGREAEAEALLSSSDNDSFVSAIKYIKRRPSRPTGSRFNFRRPT